MSPQILASALGGLRNAGSVFGLVLSNGHEIIYQDSPHSVDILGELASTVDDMAYYFEQAGRFPDQLSFGFDGGSILILLHEKHRMMVFYHHAEEVDFVGKSARAFFKDYQMNLLAEEWAPKPDPLTIEAVPGTREATQRVALRTS